MGALAACPKHGWPGKARHLTPDAPQRHEEWGCPTASLTARTANLQMLWGWCQAPMPGPQRSHTLPMSERAMNEGFALKVPILRVLDAKEDIAGTHRS